MPSGSEALELFEPLFERSRHRQDVPALLHDGDAADDLAGAVEVGDAAPQVVSDLEVPDVLQLDGLSVPVAAEDEELELVEVRCVDTAAQLILAVRDLDRASASLLKRTLDGCEHLPQGDASRAEQGREQLHLILLFEPADGGHFGDAWSGLQRRLDLALVQQAQLAQVARAFGDRPARTGKSSPCCWHWDRA